MKKGSGYVRTWDDEAGLSKDLSKETRKFLVEYTEIEPGTMEQHIIYIVSNIPAMIEKAESNIINRLGKRLKSKATPAFGSSCFSTSISTNLPATS